MRPWEVQVNVLLATDGSPSARNAEQLVMSDVWPAQTHVTVVAVEELIDGELALPEDRYTILRRYARKGTSARLADVRAALTTAGREVQTVIARGRPANVIVREAKRRAADVIVVGSRGHGAIASAVLGSVAAAVVDASPCPVLVARTPTIGHVVLAHDGSAGSRQAEELIATAGYLNTLPVTVVSVADYLPLTMTSGIDMSAIDPVLYQTLVDDQRARAQDNAGEAAERLRSRGLTVTTSVREGHAASGIVDAAAEAKADLIVIGSRGEVGLRRLVLGSVARGVLYSAPCSVLIVRQTAAVVPAALPAERKEPAAVPL